MPAAASPGAESVTGQRGCAPCRSMLCKSVSQAWIGRRCTAALPSASAGAQPLHTLKPLHFAPVTHLLPYPHPCCRHACTKAACTVGCTAGISVCCVGAAAHPAEGGAGSSACCTICQAGSAACRAEGRAGSAALQGGGRTGGGVRPAGGGAGSSAGRAPGQAALQPGGVMMVGWSAGTQLAAGAAACRSCSSAVGSAATGDSVALLCRSTMRAEA